MNILIFGVDSSGAISVSANDAARQADIIASLDLLKSIKRAVDSLICRCEQGVDDPITVAEKQVRQILTNIEIGSRIAINLAVFVLARCYKLAGNDNYVADAVADIAALNDDCALQSIYDKLYRQLDLTAAGYKRILDDAIAGNTSDLRTILKEARDKRSAKRAAAEDLVIDQIID